MCVHARSIQLCPTLCDLTDCSPPGSSVHGILQARKLEWVAMSSSSGYSQPRDRTCASCISCIAGGFFFYGWGMAGSSKCLSQALSWGLFMHYWNSSLQQPYQVRIPKTESSIWLSTSLSSWEAEPALRPQWGWLDILTQHPGRTQQPAPIGEHSA